MAVFNKFNCFVQDVANKVHNLTSGTTDVYRIYLTNTAPAATDTLYLTSAEIPAINGYLAGGATTTTTGLSSSGTFTFFGTDVSWTAGGGSIGPFRYAVLYNSTPVSKPLIGWWDYGVALTLTKGNTFTVDLDQTNGILRIA